MGRRGQHTPRMIPGDVEDAQGFPVMVVEFCEHLAIRGYAPTSLKNQRTALALLADWLIERGVTRPCEVTKPMLDAYQRAVFYMRKRNGQPLSFRTQEQRLIPVRGFFRWLVRTNRILYNPASEIELPRTEQRLPRGVLSAEEAERVLALPDLSDPLGLRDRAMMELLYATGIRRAELGSLSIFELDVERQTLTVRQGKGRKDRLVPLDADFHKRLKAYVAKEHREGSPRLFTSLRGASVALDREAVKSILDRVGEGAGVHCHAHKFRHTFASRAIADGVDPVTLQRVLGHTTLEMVSRYVHYSPRPTSWMRGERDAPAPRHRDERDAGRAALPNCLRQ